MIDPYITNDGLNVHLRDARHANQIFTEYSHAFTAKTKFLFHVAFQPSNEVVSSNLLNTTTFNKQIGVLARSAELPKFRSTTEVVNQYNRKKVMQTRVDYDDLSISFYDDNLGVTRALLEEYYRYYVKDPSHRPDSFAYETRDKYWNVNEIPNYGLNNSRQAPFFDFIKIYQLSRQEWFSYTLVNPMLTSWQHDQVDASDGSGLMENSISIAYEGVLYDNGRVGEFSEPLGFADPDTGYDLTPSPLSFIGGYRGPTGPSLTEPGYSSPLTFYNEIETTPSDEPVPSSTANNWLNSVIKGSTIPNESETRSIYTSASLSSPQSLAEQLNSDNAAKLSFINTVLLTGELSYSISDYANGNESIREVIETQALDKISSSEKVKKFAEQALGLI